MNIAEEAAKILHGLPFPLHHHHHMAPAQALCELQEILTALAIINGDFMNTSLTNLQEKVAAQADLIVAAQTRVNTLEAAAGSGTPAPVDLTQFTANADLDALAAQVDANNTALAAVSAVPAPPAPAPAA